ncbi:SGNH hydrolase-type esterase domain-containing protein, partial [Coniella lustricola]
GFAAFGDSYSVGIGTGIDGGYLDSEGACRYGQHAYPLLLHQDLNNATASNTSFQWLSCVGSQIADLLSALPSSQIDALNTSLPLSFATLSIGGNDLGYFDIMNACIFRFYAWYSGPCATALAAADTALASPLFAYHLDILLTELLDRVAWEKRPGFTITVTGYARFFNALTPACDDMSLGVWEGKKPSGAAPKLTRELRARVNGLVVATNGKLREAVQRANARFRSEAARSPRVVFVDYDAQFEGHRFCEQGVVEPAYNRTETWFFLVGGPDNAPDRTKDGRGAVRDGSASSSTAVMIPNTLDPASRLIDPQTCLARAQKRGDWGELAVCYMAMASSRDADLRPAYAEVRAQNGMWWVPTSYGKAFHPRSLGYEAIRDEIYETW